MKLLKTLFLSLMLVTVVFHTRDSKAAIGAIFAAPAIVTAGLVVAGGGATLAAGITIAATGVSGEDAIANAYGFLGVLLFIIVPGLLLLEGEQGIEFGELTREEARKLGISAQELKAYNQELDQLNMLAAHVDAEVSRDDKPTVEASAKLWSEVKDAVSADAFNALVKVNKQIFNK